jgi:hypothetical protein
MGLRPRLTCQRGAKGGRFSKLRTVCRYESWFGRKHNLKFSKSLGIYKTYTELLLEVNSGITTYKIIIKHEFKIFGETMGYPGKILRLGFTRNTALINAF